MQFHNDKLNEFFLLFDKINNKISSFEGCHGMRLIQDESDPCILFTYSVWEDSEALDKYRNSDLFLKTWPIVKLLFSRKPEAWSCAERYNGFK